MSKLNPHLEILNILMKKQNLTVRELSAKAGIPPTTLEKMFRRNSEPRIMTLVKICNGLGIRLHEFIFMVEQLMKKESNS